MPTANRRLFNTSGYSGGGSDWEFEWDFKGTVAVEVVLGAIAVGSVLTLGFSNQWRSAGYIARWVGFTSGLSFCLIHKARKRDLELAEIEKQIQCSETAWEADKQETIAQIEQAESAYSAEIERLNQALENAAYQHQVLEEAIASLQQRLKDDKKYLRRIWEFKRQNPGDANKLPKIIPAVFFDWKPGARLAGTQEYNEAKRYYIELDG